MSTILKTSLAGLFCAFSTAALIGTPSVHAMPAGFEDENFYACVEEAYREKFPTAVISADGLTADQLAQIEGVYCGSHDIENFFGVETMPNLTHLSAYKIQFPVTRPLDLTLNPKLSYIYADSYDIYATLHIEDSGVYTERGLEYVLPDIAYVRDGAGGLVEKPFYIEEDDYYEWFALENIDYDEDTRTLIIKDLDELTTSQIRLEMAIPDLSHLYVMLNVPPRPDAPSDPEDPDPEDPTPDDPTPPAPNTGAKTTGQNMNQNASAEKATASADAILPAVTVASSLTLVALFIQLRQARYA